MLYKYIKMFSTLSADKDRNLYPSFTVLLALHKPFHIFSIIDLIAQDRITENFMARKVDHVFSDILVMLAQEGDRKALDKLARRWWPRHYTHARRLLGHQDGADDVVQEAWRHIITGLRKLNDVSRFPAWSYSIVSRRCYDMIRNRQSGRKNETINVTEDHELQVAQSNFDKTG